MTTGNQSATRCSATAIRKEFLRLGDTEIATHSQRFFKTGVGEYGEGDRFRGIRVPVIRQQVKRYRDATLETVVSMLKSKWHEDRLFAVLSLADRFKRGDVKTQKQIFDLYLEHTEYVNNWDLVDSSAYHIVGPWLETRNRRRLHTLARSKLLWDRRIAVIATYHFIRRNDFVDTLEIAAILLHDGHDLIDKAVGWMLREVGNRDKQIETDFLRIHYRTMPRTMLRYAIEKFPQIERKSWLNGTI